MQLNPAQIQASFEHIPKRAEPMPGYVPAAVLVIFVNLKGGTHIVYIRRTRGLHLHSGHMAFPGGKIDPTDASSYAAAVRETCEEIGVAEDRYSYLGNLGYFETLTSRYDAAAHVAWSAQPLEYKPNPFEVAEVVEIPLKSLVQQFRPDLDSQNPDQVRYLNFRYRSDKTACEATLWGLTARVTHHLLAGLAKSHAW
ncbi:MAG: NUDIX hydrolase [bacterium]